MKYIWGFWFQVNDFCIAYRCEADENDEFAWEVVGKTCICPDEKLWSQAYSKLKEIDSRFSSNKNSPNNQDNNKTKNLEPAIKYLKTYLIVFLSTNIYKKYF